MNTSVTQERTIYSVSQLNQAAKSLLEETFPLIWVEGEISNLARPASGHLYFSLKDNDAQVRCALFRSQMRNCRCQPKDGLRVIVRARASLYAPRGDYQLILESIEDAGEGELQRAFEALKAKLSKEGLFDAQYKKALPRLPKRIGIITSPSGAVVHDILTTLKRRFPAIPVLLYPVAVQGETAVAQIVGALAIAAKRRDCDVLILARGGGSLEDLWSFNDEQVARAIFHCDIPVVCGVGHETDVTIADWVADQRAPTPTAAAELLSPDKNEWLQLYTGYEKRLLRLISGSVRELQQRLDWASRRLSRPDVLIRSSEQKIKELKDRMARIHQNSLLLRKNAVTQMAARLQQQSPKARIKNNLLMCRHLSQTSRKIMQHYLATAGQRLQRAGHSLDTLSPLSTLNRGYAIVKEVTSERIVRDAATISPGDQVEARVAKGSLYCTVIRTSKT